jgi:hypothetical protein
MKNIFFDTSILSEIAWSEGRVPKEGTWDFFLSQMDAIYPGFSEEDLTWISSTALLLEIIGLGMVRTSNRIGHSIFEKNFNPLRRSVIEGAWRQSASPEMFFQDITKQVDLFIKRELNSRNLYRQSLKFLRSYSSHLQSHFIVARVNRWSKNIRNESEVYDLFQEAFFWDSIFRYPIIDIHKIAKRERLGAMQFWAAVLGIAYREYYWQYVSDVSLEVGPLGLFAEIDRVGSFYNGFTNQRGYGEILRRWDDMVDADSIYFALIGKRITLKTNEPVIVITGDKREDIERRLKCLYKNLQIMEAKGLPINKCPGTIIPFSLETMQVEGQPLEVCDFINRLDTTEESSSNQ